MTIKFTYNFISVLQKQSRKIFFVSSQNYVTVPVKQIKKENSVIISCKRPKYNHYSNYVYNKFEEITLASKGWSHNKSKGDYFTIHPQLSVTEIEGQKPFCHLVINSLADCLRGENIYYATQFQEEAMYTIKSGNHTLLAAETGCGKTVAYLLPILEKLVGNTATNMNTPKALVLIPNRELAFQIGAIAEKLATALNLKVKTIVGGRTKKFMMNPEFSDIDLLIGTPGAIGKLSAVGIFKLNDVQHTVIDEADTLLDDSFIERMTGLLRRIPQSQLILVSATLPKKLPPYLELIEPSLKQVKSPRLHMPLLKVTQHFLRLSKSTKPTELLRLTKKAKEPMIIFTNRNETCNWLALFLRENGLKCSNINGNMHYAIRIEQWNQFVRGETKILSATDVGSRGLNTTQITHVLNYDFPLYASDYIHRVGRTGRFGSPEDCRVTNFIAGLLEIKLVQQIEMAVRTNQAIPNVDGNITNIVQKNIMRKMREVN